MQVTPTRAFLRCLRKLSKQDTSNVISALEHFLIDPQSKALNFEAVKSRRGYHTIRANYSIRVLMKQSGDNSYEVVAVGNHDFIYATYFRK